MMIEHLEGKSKDAETDASEPECAAMPVEHRARGLLAIGLFKLVKALFFIAVGIGALHLIHSNVGEVLLRLTTFLHLNPEWHFVEMMQDKADLLSGHKLRQVSVFTFGYAALSLVEGVGL